MQRRATNATSSRSVTGVARVGRERREVARFESLVGELSAAMARASADEVDREIESVAGQNLPGAGSRQERRIRARFAGRTRCARRIPGFDRISRLSRGTTIRRSSSARPPSWSCRAKCLSSRVQATFRLNNQDARRVVAKYGPKASAAIPMWAGGRVIGAASFGKFRSAREWPPELLDHLALAVRLFGSAIERKQSEMAIRAVRTELRVASRRNVDERTRRLALA